MFIIIYYCSGQTKVGTSGHTSPGNSLSNSFSPSPAPPSLSSTQSLPSTSVGRKRKREQPDEVEQSIIDSIKGIQDRQSQVTEDEESHYAKQVAATLRRFDNRQKAFAKLHIQKLLLDIEFGSAYNSGSMHVMPEDI